MRVPGYMVWIMALLALLAAGVLITVSYISSQSKIVAETMISGGETTVTSPTTSSTPDRSEEPTKTGSETKVTKSSPARAEQPTQGDPDAPVAVVEFAEFYCPYCARYLWQTYPQIERAYIDNGSVSYEFRNLPVHGLPALLAAVAGECAHGQGAFWPFHDHMFETVFPERNLASSRELGVEDLKGVAATAGLDAERFDRCLDAYHAQYQSCKADYDACTQEGTDRDRQECEDAFVECVSRNEMFAAVMEDRAALARLIEALPPDERDQAQRIGTPTFFINGQILIGAHPFESFTQIIERELERARQRP